MAMTATVLALGAAGDKAAIGLIEKGIVNRDHVKLLNTTSKDIPDFFVHFVLSYWRGLW